jgi:crotonobetainyl-CoA:carnitine CoA-transferase CaiB-like acyl-CoA transferase
LILDMDDVAELKRPERTARYDELKARIAAAIEASPRSAWADRLDQHGIPWSPVSGLDEVAADPHFRARGLFQQVGSSWHVAQPLKFDGEHPAPTRPAPGLGEHTDEVLKQFGLASLSGS